MRGDRPHWTERHWRTRGVPSLSLTFTVVDHEVLALILGWIPPTQAFGEERFAHSSERWFHAYR